jgi:hypothetical protein
MRNWKIVVVTVLALTAFSKLLGAIHPVKLLSEPDSVFGIHIYYVVVAACTVEFALCYCITFIFDDAKSAWSVFAFASIVIAYRTIANIDVGSHCPCLGNITEWWPWLGRNENSVLTTVAVWLLLTSAYQLVWGRKQT